MLALTPPWRRPFLKEAPVSHGSGKLWGNRASKCCAASRRPVGSVLLIRSTLKRQGQGTAKNSSMCCHVLSILHQKLGLMSHAPG